MTTTPAIAIHLVRWIEQTATHRKGLFRLSSPASYGYDEPLPTTEWVVISAADETHLPGTYSIRVHETAVFPASAMGDIISWSPMAEVRGSTNFNDVIDEAGWTLVVTPEGGAS